MTAPQTEVVVYWMLKWVLLGPAVRLLSRPQVRGTLPAGPVVLAPNHQTELESLVLCAALPRRLTFVAKSDYFVHGGPATRFFAVLCRATGQIPVDRSGGGRGDPALRAAERVLTAGGVWVVYPEGTRSRDGRLRRGRTGAVRVALRHPEVSLVPVGIVGAAETESAVRRRRRGPGMQVHLGAPLDLARWRGRADDPRAWREATDELMSAIAGLSGQEVADDAA